MLFNKVKLFLIFLVCVGFLMIVMSLVWFCFFVWFFIVKYGFVEVVLDSFCVGCDIGFVYEC